MLELNMPAGVFKMQMEVRPGLVSVKELLQKVHSGE
jgi:hypothetical protein